MRALWFIALVACGGGGSDPMVTPDVNTTPPDGPLPDLPPPRETKTETKSMEVGEVLEAKMIGGAADRAVIKLTAPTADLDWNIHSHPNGTTINVVSQNDVLEVEYDFVPTEDAEWFLLLRNGGPTNMDVQVTVDLYGAMTFDFL
jgi:hypothetical protein